MKILVSNDDGIYSPGIQMLAKRLTQLGTVYVIAPDRERSAAGHSLTLDRPLLVEEIKERMFSVNGTPTDCVHMAISGLFDFEHDMVVSGINHGPNMGEDVFYSGTVAAAMEGYLFGVPSIAFSQVEKGHAHLEAAAAIAAVTSASTGSFS